MVYASFRRRLGAFLLDSAASSMIAAVFYKMVPLFPINWEQAGQVAFAKFYFIYYLVVTFLIMPLYWVIFESSAWQATLGKRALKIKVVDRNGQRVSFFRAAVREYTRLLSSAPLYIGYMFSFFSTHRQTLHDKIADTYVINKEATFEEGVAPKEPLNASKIVLGLVLYGAFLLAFALIVLGMAVMMADPEFMNAIQNNLEAVPTSAVQMPPL